MMNHVWGAAGYPHAESLIQCLAAWLPSPTALYPPSQRGRPAVLHPGPRSYQRGVTCDTACFCTVPLK